MSKISANLSPQERAERLENARFVGFLAPKIIAIELRLRDQVSALRPDAYAAECAECGAPMLGQLIALIDRERLAGRLFGGADIRTSGYHPDNLDRIQLRSGKFAKIFKDVRALIALNLLRAVRNEAFHGGRLLSPTLVRGGKLRPRMFTQARLGGELLNFTVAPERIARLLDDIAAAIAVADWEEY